VKTQIQFSQHPNVLAVPASAIVSREGAKGVFLIDREAKTAVLTRVETGIIQGDFVEIASPTLDGVVVTMGHHLLEDGSPVLIPGLDAEKTPRGKEAK